VWFTTSGTTGRFKFVALTREAILHSAVAVNHHLSTTSQDVWINVLPTFHVGGVGVYARSYVSGSSVINLYSEKKRWDPQKYVHFIHKYRGTLSTLVPTQVFDLVKLQLKAPPTLRAIVVGGGVLDKTLFENGVSLGWNLLPSYGLTECASQVATAERGVYSSYKILDHVAVKIDKAGCINLKGISLFSGYAFIEEEGIYFEDPKMDGWFKTEDQGEIYDGKLTVLGRQSDFLKVGGESVNLLAVEKNLNSVKASLNIEDELILIPHHDDRLGAAIALCVRGNISVQIMEMVGSYNKTVLPYERIHHVFSVKEIPRNDMGKPLRNKLLQDFSTHHNGSYASV
jgi:O-succinylbenzoic acid--CoA ligase